MLLNSKEILNIESRFSLLFERTFFKGISGQPASSYKKQVSYWFKSKTFQKQIDKIIDDIYLFSVSFSDKKINKSLKASVNPTRHILSAADDNPLILTEEAITQAEGLAGEVVDSIVTMLKDDNLYKEAPATLESRVRELWGGEKYRATRFVRTFTADVATSSSLHRYSQQGIEEYQYYALIDGKTSPICRALHGTIFKVGSPEASKFSPPKHFHCRSSIIPVTMFSDVSDSMRYENRDFSKPMNQDFSISGKEVDSKVIKKVFKDINTFNENYRIDKFILDEDLEKRYTRIGIGIESQPT